VGGWVGSWGVVCGVVCGGGVCIFCVRLCVDRRGQAYMFGCGRLGDCGCGYG